MTRPDNILRPLSSKGWETSVANKELVDEMFPSDYTNPSLRTISLAVKGECRVKIKSGYWDDYHELTIVEEFGLELDERFGRVYSFQFLDDGCQFYWLTSY